MFWADPIGIVVATVCYLAFAGLIAHALRSIISTYRANRELNQLVNKTRPQLEAQPSDWLQKSWRSHFPIVYELKESLTKQYLQAPATIEIKASQYIWCVRQLSESPHLRSLSELRSTDPADLVEKAQLTIKYLPPNHRREIFTQLGKLDHAAKIRATQIGLQNWLADTPSPAALFAVAKTAMLNSEAGQAFEHTLASPDANLPISAILLPALTKKEKLVAPGKSPMISGAAKSIQSGIGQFSQLASQKMAQIEGSNRSSKNIASQLANFAEKISTLADSAKKYRTYRTQYSEFGEQLASLGKQLTADQLAQLAMLSEDALVAKQNQLAQLKSQIRNLPGAKLRKLWPSMADVVFADTIKLAKKDIAVDQQLHDYLIQIISEAATLPHWYLGAFWLCSYPPAMPDFAPRIDGVLQSAQKFLGADN